MEEMATPKALRSFPYLRGLDVNVFGIVSVPQVSVRLSYIVEEVDGVEAV
jgi:hypothetical protein